MYKKAFILLLTLVLFGFSQQQNADISVEAEGIGRDVNEAMVNAKRAAVEKGIGTIIQSQTEIKNFMLSKDVILTRTIGAVKSVEMLSESKGADKMTSVKIRAVVSSGQIRDDLVALNILLESVQKPRIMVMIQETIDEQDNSISGVAETEIIKFLTEKEIDVIDKEKIEQLRIHEAYLNAVKGNSQAAASLGASAGAEVAIIGTATSSVASEMAGQLGGMKSCQADIAIKVIVCSNGKLIASKNEHAAAAHISTQTAGAKAIAAAAKKSIDSYLFDKIVASWQDAVNNGILLKVTVTNAADFNLTKQIPDAIKKCTPAVMSITERNWKKQSGIVEYDIVYKGTGRGFCESVHNKTISGKRFFSVTASNSNSVEIRAAVRK